MTYKTAKILVLIALFFLPIIGFAIPKCAGTLYVTGAGAEGSSGNYGIRVTMVNRTAKRNPPGVKIDVRIRYVHRAWKVGPKHHKVLCQSNKISPKKGKNSIVMIAGFAEGQPTGIEPQFRESGHKTWYSCPDQLHPVSGKKLVNRLVRFWEFSNNRHVACSMH